MLHGEPVIVEFSSADASAAASITIRKAGATTSYTLDASERLYLQTLVIVGTGVSVDIFDDVNGNGNVDANERLTSVAAGTTVIPFRGTDDGSACGKGRLPKVKASAAGVVIVTGIGCLRKD